MAVNDIIKEADYNSIRNKVIGVMSVGSGNSGYGQTILSTAVAVGNKVSINEWANLRYDIINAYVHQNGTTPATVTISEGGRIRFSAVDAPVTTYDTLANNLVSNRFNVGVGQSSINSTDPISGNPYTTSTNWPGPTPPPGTPAGPYGATWNTKIQCTVGFTFATANAARHFFNSGGQINIASSRSGGSLGTSQATQWTTILSGAGSQSFGGNNPGTGTSPNDGTNWYRCTNSFQQYYSRSGSSPYGSNSYRLLARVTDVAGNSTGTSKSGEIRVEFVDNYIDPAVPPHTPSTIPPIDQVDGLFTTSLTITYASGVLVPSGTGNFTVSIPTITLSAIAP